MIIEIRLERACKARSGLPLLRARVCIRRWGQGDGHKILVDQVLNVIRGLTIIDPVPEGGCIVSRWSDVKQTETSRSIEGETIVGCRGPILIDVKLGAPIRGEMFLAVRRIATTRVKLCPDIIIQSEWKDVGTYAA